MAELEFEKPIVQLRNKIRELKEYTNNSQMDFSEEIRILEAKLENLENEVYGSMKVWDRVQIARHAERPTTLDYIEHLFTDFFSSATVTVLFGDDAAIVGGIAKYKGTPITVIGHQRGKDTKENIRRNFGMPHPEGYRKALRLMKQAEKKFKRPIVCFY
ncbi:hypothetical protein GCM10020331_032240 [Ectobacillus funiculus]